MYASINQWSYGGEMTPQECLRAAITQGFEGFEPAFSAEGPLSAQGFLEDAKTLAHIAHDEGIHMNTLASGVYWQYPLSSDDASVRQRSRELICAQIDCAAELGAKVILVVPGTVGKGFFGTGAAYSDAWERALDGLREVSSYAKAAGVIIGIENVWNNFLLSPMEFARFIDEVDSPFVQAYFDVGNVILYAQSEDWIRTLAKRIAAVHVKDFKRAIGTINGFVPLLEGDVDWPEVMKALRETGYDGPLTAEIAPVKLDPLLAGQAAREALRKILTL